MKPVAHPPDANLRAYADLLNQVFLFLRGRSHDNALDQEHLFDLADALHQKGCPWGAFRRWTSFPCRRRARGSRSGRASEAGRSPGRSFCKNATETSLTRKLLSVKVT